MKSLDSEIVKSPSNRRSFLKNAAGASAAVAALGLVAPAKLFAADNHATPMSPDTPAQIFTAALVAEDLASTFYYYALTGPVIQDINLAGPGGTATKVTANGSASNVGYIRAALSEEIVHANLFRSLLGIGSATKDPYQSFYIPNGSFETLNAFISLLGALENAFIAAYMAAVQEFALLAAQGKPLTFAGQTYYPRDLAYYAKIAASILGVEAEHRALGRAIEPNLIPANEINFQQDNYVYTVYNGNSSAVKALTPFLAPGSGLTKYSLQDALNNASKVTLPTYHSVPLEYYY